VVWTCRLTDEQISKNRRVAISEFKGKFMVNIREYYEADGKQLPGKKVRSPGQKMSWDDSLTACRV